MDHENTDCSDTTVMICGVTFASVCEWWSKCHCRLMRRMLLMFDVRKDIFTVCFLSDVAVFNPVVFIVPAVLLFILIFALFVLCKCKRQKVKGMFYIQYKCMYIKKQHIHTGNAHTCVCKQIV